MTDLPIISPNQPLRKQVLKRFSALKSIRSGGYDSHWRTLSENFLPRASRFNQSDRNQENSSQWNNIIDSSGTRALRVLAAGMMAGMTSPARPWFILRVPDEALNKSQNVRQWCQDVSEIMARVFQKSNTYNALHAIYRELGVFGTAANFISPDFDTVIHNYAATAGEYVLATDNRMIVDTICRECQITVTQALQWGFNVSDGQRAAYMNGDGDTTTMDIVHAVQPRTMRDTTKRDAKNMPWQSIYVDQSGDDDRILAEGGFRSFPATCPRWDVCGNDTYGWSPAMEALGDTLQLQQEQLAKSKAIDYKADPPLQLPTALKDRDADVLPGGISYFDASGPGMGIRTAFDVQLDTNELQADIQDVRQRLNSAFYADIFLLLSQQPQDTKMTATEVAERHEEKLLMLGPVLERLQNELLTPLIEATFFRLSEAGVLPPPPQELQGVDIQVEFVSMLAQAQKAIQVNSVDRFVANLGSIAAVKPNILDRFNEDGWVDYYSDVLGVDANLVIPMQTAVMIRNQRAQQQQQAEAAAQANSVADTAQKGASAAESAQRAGIQLPVGAGYSIGGGTPLQLSPGAGVGGL